VLQHYSNIHTHTSTELRTHLDPECAISLFSGTSAFLAPSCIRHCVPVSSLGQDWVGIYYGPPCHPFRICRTMAWQVRQSARYARSGKMKCPDIYLVLSFLGPSFRLLSVLPLPVPKRTRRRTPRTVPTKGQMSLRGPWILWSMGSAGVRSGLSHQYLLSGPRMFACWGRGGQSTPWSDCRFLGLAPLPRTKIWPATSLVQGLRCRLHSDHGQKLPPIPSIKSQQLGEGWTTRHLAFVSLSPSGPPLLNIDHN